MEYVSAAPSANVIVVMLNFSILTLPLDVRTRATPSKTSPVMLADPAVMLETPAAGRALRAAVCLRCGCGECVGGGEGVASTGGAGDAETVGNGVAVGVTLGAGDALAVVDGVGLPVGVGEAALLEPPRRPNAPLASVNSGRLDAADGEGAKSQGTDAG
jgi:hypothetical protein